MKDKLKKILKKVIITGKTYTEYIDALADRLVSEGVTLPDERNENSCVMCGAVIPEGGQVCPRCKDDERRD